MADVARLARVSVSTVSYAMTGSRPVSAATRARIEAAMAELKYTPNVLARGLRGRKSNIIALVFPTSGRGLDLSGLDYILGASDYAQSHGFHLLLWTTEVDSSDSLRSFVGAGLVDGVLLMEVRVEDERVTLLGEAGIPLAMIGRTGQPRSFDWVDTDFEQSVRASLEYLASLGHRRVAFVNQPASMVTAGLGGAVRAERSAQIAAADLGLQLVTVRCGSSADAGRTLIGELLEADPELTAVVGYNEQAIPGVMAGAMARGLRVPQDLSVIAVALCEQAAMMSTPAMTTVSPPAREMGRAGAAMLIRRLEGGKVRKRQRLFPGVLAVRGTTGPVQGAPGN